MSIDWSKPIRRTDKEFADATGFRVLATDLEGEFPVIVAILGYSRPITLHYRKDGSHQGTPYSVWENVPEEEWIVKYISETGKAYTFGCIYSNKGVARTNAAELTSFTVKSKYIIRLSDGYTEEIT